MKMRAQVGEENNRKKKNFIIAFASFFPPGEKGAQPLSEERGKHLFPLNFSLLKPHSFVPRAWKQLFLKKNSGEN